MKELVLTNGDVTLLDDEDYEWASRWNWYCNSGGYVFRIFYVDRKRKTVFLHRLVAKTPPGLETDHINHNRLDNRKCNLRNCTTLQNLLNSRPAKINKCGYKGVYLSDKPNKWRAKIVFQGKRIYLGYFNTPEDAARAYDEAAKFYFGDYAYTNF